MRRRFVLCMVPRTLAVVLAKQWFKQAGLSRVQVSVTTMVGGRLLPLIRFQLLFCIVGF